MGVRVAVFLALVIALVYSYLLLCLAIRDGAFEAGHRPVSDRAVLTFREAVPDRMQTFVGFHAAESALTVTPAQSESRGESLDEWSCSSKVERLPRKQRVSSSSLDGTSISAVAQS